MDLFNEKRELEANEIIAVIRLLFIYLIISSIYSIIPNFSDNITYLSIMFVITIIAATFKTWGYFVKTSNQNLNATRKDIIHSILYALLITAIVNITGAYDSKYKNLYFMVIIISSIRFGSKMGFLASALSAAGIIFNDMIFLPIAEVNSYLEADLIIIVTFFITGWMLGKFMENEIKYRKQLSHRASADEVTGLYNHRYFQERLSMEIQRARKSNYGIALIMIDLDYFKFYNDTYGHQEGDVLLRQIGAIIKKCIRNNDVVCRYGGDEFAVIMLDTTAEAATKVAEKIRESIDVKKFFGEESQPGNDVTASVGISLYPQNASDKDELIKRADDAMYKAKFMSKNRVELYFSVLDDLKSSLNESDKDLINSIRTLITVINAKDKYTYGHSERVVLYATIIGEAMGLDSSEIKKLRYSAYLHDIGKIEISREILNKTTRLTEEEWQILKNHPVWGAEIIKPVQALKDSIPAIMHHHERFDGKGYPDGLKGYDIPLHARILALADSYDAMVTKRPYKEEKKFQESVEELERCKGTQFDPDITDKFIEALIPMEDTLKDI